MADSIKAAATGKNLRELNDLGIKTNILLYDMNDFFYSTGLIQKNKDTVYAEQKRLKEDLKLDKAKSEEEAKAKTPAPVEKPDMSQISITEKE